MEDWRNMKTGHWKYINHWRRQQAREKEAAGLVCIGLIIIVLKPGETAPLTDHMVMIIIMTEESIFVVTLSPLCPNTCCLPPPATSQTGSVSVSEITLTE